jgi:hypothetical protein
VRRTPIVSLHDLDPLLCPLAPRDHYGRLCRKKASDCQRIALTTEEPRARRIYLQIARLWREMANMRETGEPSNEGGVVIDFPRGTRR